MDRGPSCPGKEEQADSRTKGGRKSWNETTFLNGPTTLSDAGVHVEVEVGDVEAYANHTRDENAEEDETDLTKVHVVVDWVDTGENLED